MQKNKAVHSIEDVQTTDDLLTGRAGLNLFVKYLLGIEQDFLCKSHFLRIRLRKKIVFSINLL